MTCKEAECLHPDYDKAVDAERDAIKEGNFNFAGIGYNSPKI